MNNAEIRFAEAMNHIRNENFKGAEECFVDLTKQGNIHAQINLATLYLDPNNGFKKYKEAYELLMDAVNKDDGIDAANSLGMMYLAGLHVERDYKEAKKWFQKGADGGIAACLINLGKLEVLGANNNGEPNIHAAINLFIESYKQGFPDGLDHIHFLISDLNMKELSTRVFDSYIQHVEQNLLTEYEGILSQDDGETEYVLAQILDQIEGHHSCKEAAYNWYLKAHEKGLNKATNNLGAMHLKGEFVKQNYEEAMKFFKISAENGDTFAMKNLGASYLEGFNSKVDLEAAHYWLQKSMDGGCQEAIAPLAFTLYMLNPEQPSKYLDLMEKACDMNHSQCLMILGGIYVEGNFVKKDFERGISLLKRASNLGEGAAALLVGVHLINTNDPSRLNEAAKYLLLSTRNTQSSDVINISAEIFHDHRENKAFGYKEAIRLNKILADKGDAESQARLAKLYIGSKTQSSDMDQAIKYAKLSAKQGNVYGLFLLTSLYTTNYLDDPALLYETLDKLEEKGNEGSGFALFSIGQVYETGCKSIAVDKQTAAEYYSRAANLGDPLAIEKMKAMFKH